MKIKVPFKKGLILYERNIEFIFNLGCLEDACTQLEIDFWQMSDVNFHDFSLAVLYQAYIQGCKQRYRKPRYKLRHAKIWTGMMSSESREQVANGITGLMGKMKTKQKTVKKK